MFTIVNFSVPSKFSITAGDNYSTASTLPLKRDGTHKRSHKYNHSSRHPPSSLCLSNGVTPLVASWSYLDAEGNRKSVFNSLPRSFYKSSLPRRSRLPKSGYFSRNDSNNGMYPESSSSSAMLLQKSSFPPPTCPGEDVHSNGFHCIFKSLLDPSCNLTHLDLSKSSLGAEDLVCLGDAIRYTNCLTTLRMEGLARVAEIIPIIVALQSATNIQSLDLTSSHLLLDDSALQIFLTTVCRCESLRFLSISGWTFHIEYSRSLECLTRFLSVTRVQHLEMSAVRILVTLPEDGPLTRRPANILAAVIENAPTFSNETIAFLNLDNTEVEINSSLALRGPLLIPLLRYFPRLISISLGMFAPTSSYSAPLTSPLSTKLCRHAPTPLQPPMSFHDTATNAPTLQDTQTKQVFGLLASSFPSLRRLNMSGWLFALDNSHKASGF